MSGKYQFETTVLTLTIAGVLIKLRTVLHPETLFDQMLEKGNNHDDVVNERIPYWAELWPASIAMAEFLLNNRHLSEGKRLLEIGCGLGLAGIAANLSNAQVTMSDYLQEAVDIAKINWRLNFDTPPNVRLLD
ncbi:MAG TPA: methyltransferase, partial [Saprospiraceae bacterium]|nr:methyltransferase [Saprospiraceae bacterium]